MYEYGFPFDNAGITSMDRNAGSDEFADYLETITGMEHGVYPNPSTGLHVTAGSGLNVKIGAGACMIKGRIKRLLQDTTVNLQAAENLDRIDRIVMRLDKSIDQRRVAPYVLKGTAATSPAAPALTRSGDIYEIALADVRISRMATSVSQAQITDLRANTNLCGYMPVFGSFDTTSLFNQYQDALNKYLDLVDAALDDTAAGYLQGQIDEVRGEVNRDKVVVFNSYDELRKYLQTCPKYIIGGRYSTLTLRLADDAVPPRRDESLDIEGFHGRAEALEINLTYMDNGKRKGTSTRVNIRNNKIPIRIRGIHYIYPYSTTCLNIWYNSERIEVYGFHATFEGRDPGRVINIIHSEVDFNPTYEFYDTNDLTPFLHDLEIVWTEGVDTENVWAPIDCENSKVTFAHYHYQMSGSTTRVYTNANIAVTARQSEIYVKNTVTFNKIGFQLTRGSVLKQFPKANIIASQPVTYEDASLWIKPSGGIIGT